MFEKFTSAGAGDFRQRYQGTYGFFTTANKKILAQLVNVNPDRARPSLEFVDKDGMEYSLLADSKDQDVGFTFLSPKSSWHNTTDVGFPLLVQRIPAKQYQRGICERNTSITTPTGTRKDISFATLNSIYESKVSVAEALSKAVANKRGMGVALSPQFCLDFYNKKIKLFNADVGFFEYADGKFVATLEYPDLWRQELTDCFNRNKLIAEVK